jgi:hypothetical protein
LILETLDAHWTTAGGRRVKRSHAYFANCPNEAIGRSRRCQLQRRQSGKETAAA